MKYFPHFVVLFFVLSACDITFKIVAPPAEVPEEPTDTIPVTTIPDEIPTEFGPTRIRLRQVERADSQGMLILANALGVGEWTDNVRYVNNRLVVEGDTLATLDDKEICVGPFSELLSTLESGGIDTCGLYRVEGTNMVFSYNLSRKTWESIYQDFVIHRDSNHSHTFTGPDPAYRGTDGNYYPIPTGTLDTMPTHVIIDTDPAENFNYYIIARSGIYPVSMFGAGFTLPPDGVYYYTPGGAGTASTTHDETSIYLYTVENGYILIDVGGNPAGTGNHVVRERYVENDSIYIVTISNDTIFTGVSTFVVADLDVGGTFVSNDSIYITIDSVDYFIGFVSSASAGFYNENPHEIHFGRSPAFEDYTVTDGTSGGATFTKKYNVAETKFPRGNRYFEWNTSSGTVVNGQWREDLPSEYVGDTSKAVAIRVMYRSTGSVTLNVWQNRTNGSWITNSSDLVTDNSGDIASVTTVRRIAETTVDQFGFILNMSTGATFELSDIQVAVIDPLKIPAQFEGDENISASVDNRTLQLSLTLEGGDDIEVSGGAVKSYSWQPHQEIPISKALGFTDSLEYATSQFIIGGRTCGDCVSILGQSESERGKYIWQYSGTVNSEQHRATFPEKYESDTSTHVILKLAYELTDNGSQGNTSIQMWQSSTQTGNFTNSTNLISATTGITRVIETRTIINTADNVKAIVSVASEDVLKIHDLQFFVVDPNGNDNLELYQAPVTYQPHPSTIDTTAATKLIVDAGGGGDFTRLDSALQSLSDGANGAWNEILVMPGTYWHRQVSSNSSDRLPDFTIIRGYERDNTRVHMNGATTAEAPTDEDVFIITKNTIIENLTLEVENGKYCLHLDQGGEFYAAFNHLKLIGVTTGQTIGGGLLDNQYVYFDGIEMETLNSSGSTAINYHTASINNEMNAIVSFKNMFAKNMGFATIGDSGGEGETYILENIRSDGIGFGLNFTSSHGDGSTHLNVIMSDVDVDYVTHSTAPDSVYFVPGYHVYVENNSGASLAAGTPVVLDYSTALGLLVDTISTENDFDFVIYSSSIADGERGMAVQRGKSALVKNVDATYAKGDYLKVNSSGLFEKTTVLSEMVAVSLEAVTTTDDLLKVRMK